MAKDSHPSSDPDIVPPQPIDRIVKPLAKFIHVQTAGGAVLIAATVVALVLANSPLADSYLAFWKTHVGLTFGSFEFNHSLKHLINDGLMVIFFFVIGLEVKREFVLGELQDRHKAALPIAAALGGMLVPALLYLLIASGGPAQHGWGIPMATDIAFVVGCMAILGKRIPSSLRVILLTLAIAMAVMMGLVIGKPVGIFVASWLAVAAGIAKAPDCDWKLVFAGGCLAGIGFTMSLFVAELALEDEVLTTAKIGVLMGSVIAAAIGMSLIILMQPAQNSTIRDPNADYS